MKRKRYWGKIKKARIFNRRGKKIEEALKEAQKTLDYFIKKQKSGELTDPTDIEEINEIKVSIKSLEDDLREINKEIKEIESIPEVAEKLYEAAKKEEIERTVEEKLKEAREKLILKLIN